MKTSRALLATVLVLFASILPANGQETHNYLALARQSWDHGDRSAAKQFADQAERAATSHQDWFDIANFYARIGEPAKAAYARERSAKLLKEGR